VQARLALRYLDRLLVVLTEQTFREWVKERRDRGVPWYSIAIEMSQVTGVDTAPETIRRYYEHP
jgi:hypothetical protein